MKKMMETLKEMSTVRIWGNKRISIFSWIVMCTAYAMFLVTAVSWVCEKLEAKKLREEDNINRAAMSLIYKTNEAVMDSMKDSEPIKIQRVQTAVAQTVGKFFKELKEV